MNTCVKQSEFVLLEKSHLEEVFSNVNCGECDGSVKLSFVQKKLDCELDVICEVCGNITKSKVNGTPVSNMVVYSCMENGVGYDGVNKLLANMNMKPLAKKYTEHSRTVTEAANSKAKDVLEKSAKAVKAYYKDKTKHTA